MTEPEHASPSAHPARSHFTMIPNLVGDLDLDPYAFRLYCHLRRVTGESGAAKPGSAGSGAAGPACWQSTATLAAHCHMSAGKVSQAKRQLVALDLIRIEKRTGPGGVHDHITLVNNWDANRRHFASPPPPRVHPANASQPPPEPARIHPTAEAIHPANASAPPRTPSVHDTGASVRAVSATPSPGETNQTPSNQTSSSREMQDDDEVGIGEGEKNAAFEVVSRLFVHELGRAPTPLQRKDIAELVALCDDAAVWERAFLRSADARNRWAYIAQCIRNAAEEMPRATPDSTPGDLATTPETPASPWLPPLEPTPAYAARWDRVLEVARWKLPVSVYQQGFGRTVCTGERDGGATWEVTVQRPAFLGWLQHPSHTPFVDKLLRQCGYDGVTVDFVLAPDP